MRLVIVESPYAGEVERNVAYARRCINDCLARKESAIASHLLFTQPGILDDLKPEERELGISAGLVWYRVAEAICFYIDLGWSPGMRRAFEHARRLFKQIEIRALDRILTAEDLVLPYRALPKDPIRGD